MKFGLLFRAQDPPDASNLTRRWQDILEAGQLAEEVGFDGLFLPEHHMMDDGYVPAPLVGLGALAAVTKRVDLGTTIMLLPFYNPVQVAEHAAMVDVISDGRMILGVGVGNFEPEFELFGRTSKDQTKLFEESITIVRRLWAGEDVEHKSEYFDVKGRIRPLPKDGGRLWMGAMSFPGVRRAARFGAPWPCDPLHNIHVIKEWADAYRAEGEAHGTSDKLSLALLRDGWVGGRHGPRSSATGGPRSGPSTGSTSPRSRAGWPTGSRSSRGSRRRTTSSSRTTTSTGSWSAAPSSASRRSAGSRTRSRTTT